jgi:hypothetical protein
MVELYNNNHHQPINVPTAGTQAFIDKYEYIHTAVRMYV